MDVLTISFQRFIGQRNRCRDYSFMSLSKKFTTPFIWKFMDLWKLNRHLFDILLCLAVHVYLMEGIICGYHIDCLFRLIFLQLTPQQKFHFARPCIPSEAWREGIFSFSWSFYLYLRLWNGSYHAASKDSNSEACLLLIFSNICIWMSLWKFWIYTVKHIINLREVSTMKTISLLILMCNSLNCSVSNIYFSKDQWNEFCLSLEMDSNRNLWL